MSLWKCHSGLGMQPTQPLATGGPRQEPLGREERCCCCSSSGDLLWGTRPSRERGATLQQRGPSDAEVLDLNNFLRQGAPQ